MSRTKLMVSEVSNTLKNEIVHINSNIQLLHDLKENATNFIEEKKRELRKKCDPTVNFKKIENILKVCVSVKERDQILIVIEKDLSSIQNQFDIIFNHLQNIKNKINEQLELVNKTDLIMNLLNYRMYQIQYEFVTQINELVDKRKEIKQSSANESEKALEIVTIDKEINDYNDAHHSVFQSIKQQKLDAQGIYEKSINILDNYLGSVKKYFNDLVVLIQAEKAQQNLEDLPHVMLIEALEEEINIYTMMQSKGWRVVMTKSISDIPKGLRLTEDGLLVTESGKNISYEETKEQRLLDYLEMFDYVKSKSKIVLEETPSESKASTLGSTMSMEDVNYLKKYLGVPLTLALAEITAVQPKDPIHYLGHWLFKYRYNQENEEIKKIEIENLTEERNRLSAERWHKFVEEEARAAVIEIILRAEHQAMENELRRLAMALEAEEEEQNLEDEARDKFENY